MFRRKLVVWHVLFAELVSGSFEPAHLVGDVLGGRDTFPSYASPISTLLFFKVSPTALSSADLDLPYTPSAVTSADSACARFRSYWIRSEAVSTPSS
jgi:hypothetical protein